MSLLTPPQQYQHQRHCLSFPLRFFVLLPENNNIFPLLIIIYHVNKHNWWILGIFSIGLPSYGGKKWHTLFRIQRISIAAWKIWQMKLHRNKKVLYSVRGDYLVLSRGYPQVLSRGTPPSGRTWYQRLGHIPWQGTWHQRPGYLPETRGTRDWGTPC